MSLLNIFYQSHTLQTSGIAYQLLKCMKVNVTASTVRREIEKHPDSASLFAISDSLKIWKVDSVALQINTDQLFELPPPFIVHTKVRGGNFFVVNSIHENTITYLSYSGKREIKDTNVFLREWSGVVLIADANEKAGEKNYKVQHKKEWLHNARLPFILWSCLLLIALFFAVSFPLTSLLNIIPIALLICKLAGCVVAGLLLWYEIDKANPVLHQVCSAGKQTDCGAVLGTRAAKLFGWISWSEVGFFYFAGSFILLLLSVENQQPALALLSWLNLTVLPYTLFSVFYQWRIVKQWCPLCLLVQGLLVVESLICYFGFWSLSSQALLEASTILTALSAFALPVFFWVFTKPLLIKAQQADRFRKEAARLKQDVPLFATLLSSQKSVTVSANGLGLLLGNPSAKNTIIKVCNPYCGPCAKAHPEVEELLERGHVKVQIIFTATGDENDKRTKPVRHFMALQQKQEPAILQQALDDWYGADRKDYEKFAKQYPLNGELQQQDLKLLAMNQWCKEANITHTPTFFVNGYQLPDAYTIADLKYLI